MMQHLREGRMGLICITKILRKSPSYRIKFEEKKCWSFWVLSWFWLWKGFISGMELGTMTVTNSWACPCHLLTTQRFGFRHRLAKNLFTHMVWAAMRILWLLPVSEWWKGGSLNLWIRYGKDFKLHFSQSSLCKGWYSWGLQNRLTWRLFA